MITRLFMAPSKEYRKYRLSHAGKYDLIHDVHNATPLPKHVWVCELYDYTHYSKQNKAAIGEIVIDITSTMTTSVHSIIMAQYPGVIAARYFDGSVPEFEVLDKNKVITNYRKKQIDNSDTLTFLEIEGWKPFNAYVGNLTPTLDV